MPNKVKATFLLFYKALTAKATKDATVVETVARPPSKRPEKGQEKDQKKETRSQFESRMRRELQGGFQLLDLIITELKNHMTC